MEHSIVNKRCYTRRRRGEEVSYIINVCNIGGQPATNVTVRDVFDSSVELISAWPEMAEDAVWHFERLGVGQCIEMGLTVRIPRTDVLYKPQNVTGQGFVRSYRDYSTSRLPALLKNRVYVSSDQIQLSASAQVIILAEKGTELSLREHGSGDYISREDLRFLTTNKSIRLERSVRAIYHPTTISLPKQLQKVSASARGGAGQECNTSLRIVSIPSGLDSEPPWSDENQSRCSKSISGLARPGH
jgi:uncharacterized repeat protein (TIGR01451 family)